MDTVTVVGGRAGGGGAAGERGGTAGGSGAVSNGGVPVAGTVKEKLTEAPKSPFLNARICSSSTIRHCPVP